ncbi:MAG: hypothetical protein WD872_03390 [Pirellulaceae bacterium]
MSDPHALRWRIPPTGDPGLLRLGLVQIGLGAVVCALILLVAAPREMLGPALLALIPLAVFAAYRKWSKYQQSLAGSDNVWIDQAGVHWLDGAGRQQTFVRESVQAFRLACEEDTLRPVPSLTLYLAGGFESQPLELHPPADEDEVRRLFTSEWSLPERPATASLGSELDYDLAIDVYSECHDEFQEWHWEGSRAALTELFDIVAEVAQLPLPPTGAKPAGRTVLARRRAASRVRILHDPSSRVGHDTIAAPAARLQELSGLGIAALAGDSSASPAGDHSDLKFDFRLGRGNTWTFHLHMRDNPAP